METGNTENTEGPEAQPQKGKLVIIEPNQGSNPDSLVLVENGRRLFAVHRRASHTASDRVAIATLVDKVLRIGGDK